MNGSLAIGTTPARNATVLSVSPNHEDSVPLERIFHEADWTDYSTSEWTLISSSTITSSFSVLLKMRIPIVICEADLFPGSWREILAHTSLSPDPPLLIVTSRLADDRLWAEALNLGAHDVIAKPFDATEVVRILGLSWLRWRSRHGLHASRTQQTMAATGT